MTIADLVTPKNTSDPSVGPLSGLLVVDLSRALAGPHAAMMLGDLGARVIKIETPNGGDDTRSWGPPFVGPEDDPQATYFLSCNRNKESLCLDLKSDDGRKALTALIGQADVLIENFRSGVMDRLEFSAQQVNEINPRIIMLSITGFGHDGPESHRSGYDQILQGEAGLMSLTGSGPQDPQRVGVPIADLLAGMNGAFGVMAALHERHRTGIGQTVRTSLLASVIAVHAFQGTRTTIAGEVPVAQGNHHPSIAPYGLFSCRSGQVQISVGSQKLWRTFADGFDINPDDPRFVDNVNRVEHRAELITAIEDAFSNSTSELVLEKLDRMGIPAGKVRTLDEVYRWEQVASQGLLVDVEHPSLGRLQLPGPPLRFFDSETDQEVTRTNHNPPPILDANKNDIMQWLERLEGADRE